MFPCHSVKDMEGYLKTDDRMRLAKERREEREKSLGKCVCSRLCMCGCSDSQGDFNLEGALMEVFNLCMWPTLYINSDGVLICIFFL